MSSTPAIVLTHVNSHAAALQQLDRATIELLDAIARTVPRLPGAACRDHRELFYRTAVRGRGMTAARREAIEICTSCPALARCRRWLESTPERERPFGVVAGQVIPPRGDLSFVRARGGRAADQGE